MRTIARAALIAAGLLAMAGCSTQWSNPEPKFVGSEECRTCHKPEYRTWKDSWHAKMVRPAAQAMLKDASDSWAKDAKGNAGPTKANISGTAAKKEDVVMVVGARWKQRYLVVNPQSGGHQFLDKQWNTLHKQWEPYGQKNTWEGQCATCHVTGYKVLAINESTRAVTKWEYTEKGIGCEACHGPGSRHVASEKRQDIFNPGRASHAEASKVCGYCHIRAENYNFKTPEGNPAEQLPHPEIGKSYRAGFDDWTAWYPDKALIPSVHDDDPVAKNYPNTDLNNAFWLDDQFAKSKLADARKHHEQYQEHLQTKHAKANVAGCSSCHSSHGYENPAKKPIVARESCSTCHKETMDVDKLMPGTASTAQNLFVRTHTFNPNQARKTGPTIPANAPEPAYVGK